MTFARTARTSLACLLLAALAACSGNGSTISKPSNHSSSVRHWVVQSGKRWEAFPLPSGGTEPEWITNGPDGNVWFTESTLASIDQINVTTGAITRFPISQAATAITAGSDGNLWFCEGNTPRIGVMTPLGVLTEYPLPMLCDAMTSTSDGSIWVNGGNEIQRVTSGGVVTQYPVPSGRSVTGLGVGSDGDVWFLEKQHCPPQCFKRRMFGKITLGGTITEYNYFNHLSTFVGEDMVLGHDGYLYTLYGIYGKMLQILPDGTTHEVDGAGVGGSTLIAGARGEFYTIGRHAALYEGGLGMSPHFLQQPPNGPDARDLVLASDGNIWITQQHLNSIAVYLRHQIRPVPTSITVGVGRSQTLSISETKFDEGWQVVSSDPSVATVSMISKSQYSVTGVSTGSCSILITDTLGNQVAVPVTVD